MTGALQRAWLRRGALACALWPMSLAYAAVIALRRAAYRAGLFSSQRAGVPVVVVGNVVAGGGGKTPVVLALVQHLKSRGISCGVVSRGYGRATQGCREVTPDSDPRDAGDEPQLVAQSSRVPVFVAARRIDAARALLAAHPATQVILCDDGLQHLSLARDIEICVFDDRGMGNGWLLPAGPLRESWPRAVDFVLRPPGSTNLRGFACTRSLSGAATRADRTTAALDSFGGRSAAAVAAIANPEPFFAMLRAAGMNLVRTVALPDHDPFTSDPLPGESAVVFCTEKDAAKLWKLRPDAWAVPLQLSVDPAFWTAFDRSLDAKLSSRHGPQTA